MLGSYVDNCYVTVSIVIMIMIMTIFVSYNLGSSWVNNSLPTYPSLKPTFTLTAHLEQNVGLGEG